MLIDVIFVILMVLAAIKGFRRGLIVGIFSFIAVIVGLAAAMKLSAMVAVYLGDSVNVSKAWLPVLSFAIVFIGVVLLIRLGANLLQKTAEAITLGWLNRLAGTLLYMSIYLIVFSIVLFYAGQLSLIKEETTQASITYNFIQPWGPKAIGAISYLLPFFRDMFSELESFFENISSK